jgi:thioredoxin 1
MSVTNIFESEFDEKVINNDKVVVVDFYAEWCGPCKMLSPLIEKVSADYKDVEFFSVDIDENPNFAADLAIEGVPTLIRFKNGEEAARSVGLLPVPKLVKFVEGE